MVRRLFATRTSRALAVAASLAVALGLLAVPAGFGATKHAGSHRSTQRTLQTLCSEFYTNVQVAPVSPPGAGLARGYPIDCKANATGQLSLSGASSLNGPWSALYTCNFSVSAGQGPTEFCPNAYPGGHCLGLYVRAFMWANVGGTVISYTSGPLRCT